MARRPLLLALLVVLALVAGCGTDEGADGTGTEAGTGTDPALGADEQVIRDWSDALRAGDVEKASTYFAVPSIAENGPPAVKLRSEDDVRAFNASLPCGAKLTDTAASDKFITATFELTDRPGGACGQGVGGVAKTTFVITGGKIAEWRRVSDVSEPAGPIA